MYSKKFPNYQVRLVMWFLQHLILLFKDLKFGESENKFNKYVYAAAKDDSRMTLINLAHFLAVD